VEDLGVVSRKRRLPSSYALEHSIQDATVLRMTLSVALLENANVQVKSGLTMTVLKQGVATWMEPMRVSLVNQPRL